MSDIDHVSVSEATQPRLELELQTGFESVNDILAVDQNVAETGMRIIEGNQELQDEEEAEEVTTESPLLSDIINSQESEQLEILPEFSKVLLNTPKREESIASHTPLSRSPSSSSSSSSSSFDASSPFVLNPDIVVPQDIRLQDYSTLSSPERDHELPEELEVEEDNSKESIAEPINDMEIVENTLDSAHFDETRYQLDRDLDIDSTSSQKSYLDKGKRYSYTGNHTNGSAPWRQLRSSKLYINSPPSIKSKFTTTTSQPMESYLSSNNAKVEDLNKQIMGYRIEIRLLKNFLQRIIQDNQENDEFNIGDLRELQHNFNLSEIGSDRLSKERELSNLQEEYQKLQTLYNKQEDEYNEIFKLNEDLYSNLESFQNDLHNKESLLNRTNGQIKEWSQFLDQVLSKILTSSNSIEVISEIRDIFEHDEGSISPNAINTKLQIIKREIEVYGQQRAIYPLPPSTTGDNQNQYQHNNNSNGKLSSTEIQGYIRTIEDLMKTLATLQNEIKFHINNTTRVESDLRREIEISRQLKDNYGIITEKFKTLSESIELNQIPSNIGESHRYESLRVENQRLSKLNKSVDLKLDEYQRVIDHLQEEVNNLKEQLDINTKASGVDTTDMHNVLLNSHKEVNELHNELHELTEKYRKLQVDTSKTISSLTNQLQNKKQETILLKTDKIVNERLRQELDIAVEKQRILQAEKIRLKYSVESLTNDKVALQSNITNLTDKITSYTVEKGGSDDVLLKKLNILEYQFEEFFLFDVLKFQRLLNSFVKIADDASLRDPKKKIDWLAKHVLKSNDESEGPSRKWDMTDLKKPYQYHKSVFEYFTRAVDIIVHDHVKLLLKEGEENRKTEDYVAKLQQRIEELNAVNDALTDVSESTTDANETTSTSPRTKLRLEELTNRWKAEREARVYENKASHKRLRELEVENAKLRNELSRLE